VNSVLIIGGRSISRMMLRTLIEENYPGVSVSEADCIEQGLSYYAVQEFDGVVLEVNSTGTDGLGFMPEIQAIFPSATIVMLTGNFQDHLQAEAEALGLQFFTKPATLDKVNHFINS